MRTDHRLLTVMMAAHFGMLARFYQSLSAIFEPRLGFANLVLKINGIKRWRVATCALANHHTNCWLACGSLLANC